ncbi:hypothetical protein EXIGLDRAFT_327744 [Exidia glandulosa HHB12029]|uniref:Uncharacterized protein n=1 Tax=Exidia glandulosa HHB12029 TaxID=1314781 RepID=A0A165LP84_EXIGL|nr:hypothetical protein EXIGLDRAFT_327744 [Exidia glandulosa HHB12029]
MTRRLRRGTPVVLSVESRRSLFRRTRWPSIRVNVTRARTRSGLEVLTPDDPRGSSGAFGGGECSPHVSLPFPMRQSRSCVKGQMSRTCTRSSASPTTVHAAFSRVARRGAFAAVMMVCSCSLGHAE